MKIGESTYYCWNCDAHRRIAEDRGPTIKCPKCAAQLEKETPVTLAFSTPPHATRLAEEHAVYY